MGWRLSSQASATHGGQGGGIDLSASLNPLGPSMAALDAARAARLDRYPPADAGDLRRAAAFRHGIGEERVVPVPGASFGLWLLITVLTQPRDVCVALAPCFGEYRRSAEIAGAHYREVRATEPDFDWNLDQVSSKLSQGAALCLLANPANPSGRGLAAEDIRALCQRHPATLFLVDEAFAEFGPPGISLLECEPTPNAIVVRSLTKELGLPGLRMGYLVADPGMAGRIAGVMPPWSLSAPSFAAAVAGMADLEHITQGARVAQTHVRHLADAFCSSGFNPVASSANYLLVKAPGAAAALMARGITVRDCASFGLSAYVRVAAPSPTELPAVLDAVRSLRSAHP
jgi:histidinol-phosphate/aromatic aminotransferase/cobyric acid decarboxylase-like protein